MTENGYGMPQVAGHVGRIPNYGKPQADPRSYPEPPACIQNAMMTKDKKPFTYTPGGLDLSQIRTPSMARRLARQRSQEEQEQAYAHQPISNGATYNGQRPAGPAPPPPPMPQAPPPPPPLIIENAKSPKPVPLGERPEIIIPENPVAMLRKTNSPYHWEQEQAEKERLGAVPKFVEKAPSPNMHTQMSPSSFSQQPPSAYNMPNSRQFGSNQPDSPVHKPAPQYAHNVVSSTTNSQGPTRDLLQRQDSQFNKSPTPFSGTGSPLSPGVNWKQPEKHDSPLLATSPPFSRGPMSPINSFKPNVTPESYASPPLQHSPPPQSNPTYNTFPRSGGKIQTSQFNNIYQPDIYQSNNNQTNNNINKLNNNTYRGSPNEPVNSNGNQYSINTNTWNSPPTQQNNNTSPLPKSKEYTRPRSPKVEESNIAPWRANTLNRSPKEQQNSQMTPSPNQDYNTSYYNSPYNTQSNENTPQNQNNNQPEKRYQSYMTIPVTQKAPKEPEKKSVPHKEVVFVTEEPVYYAPPENSKALPPWVRNQREKTPPPEWVQRPLDVRRSIPRESPPKEKQVEPEWVQRSNEMRRSIPRDISSPPKTQSTQPVWSTIPSENRKSTGQPTPVQFTPNPQDTSARMIPVQMEVSDRQQQTGQSRPQLRITIGMQPSQDSQYSAQPPYSQPTQRIMRVLSPQLVKIDNNGNNQTQQAPAFSPNQQPKERIIPIRMESFDGGASKSFGGRF